MKMCPVCKALAFDDAEICYGCLHRFEDDMDDLAVEVASASSIADDACAGPEPQEAEGQTARLPLVQAAQQPWDASVDVSDNGRTIIVRLSAVAGADQPKPAA